MRWRSTKPNHWNHWKWVCLATLLVAVLVRLGAPVVAAADSPIATAAKAGDTATVRALIASRADVNAPGADGSAPILWATYNSDIEMVRMLIAAGAKVDVPNRYGVTPLLQASRTGDTAVIEALARAGADPKLAHPDGETPLTAAARAGRADAVRLLLARGADVNAVDVVQGQTALMRAAAEGHLDAVQALLEAGAKPNIQARVTSLTKRKNADFPTGGFTALMWAARNGYADVVNALVKGGANPTLANGDGATASIIAIVNDRLDIAGMLLDLGSDPNDGSLYFAVDMHDGTTDMRARDGGLLRWDHPNTLTALDLIKRLLERGADPNKPFVGQLHSISLCCGDEHNATPFYRAAIASDVDALTAMLPYRPDLEWKPTLPPGGGRGMAANVGKTPIMVAATGGLGASFGGGPGFYREGPPPYREAGSRVPQEAVQVLLSAGADVNAQVFDDGNTALHQAAERNDLDMIRLLANAGGNLDTYNWIGQRPLDIAEEAADRVAKNPNAPDAATILAMVAGTPLPEKKDPNKTVAFLRELMKLPLAPPAVPTQPAENTTAAAGGRQ